MFGPDDRGCVRGIGGKISKSELIASAISREQLRQERQKTKALDGRVRCLEETVEILKAGVNCNANTQVCFCSP